MKTRNRRSRVPLSLLALVALSWSAAPAPVAAAEIRVDAARQAGRIRALHGVNGGPICYGSVVDLTAAHRELGIPFTRVHDSNWPSTDVVNIHAVFPDFRADPESPASYDFGPTDDYLKGIVATRSGIVYRLGESIEHTPRKRHVHKPADFDKWAKVCLGIIRHYNEGWADGFRWDVRYWEIWNEPEIGAPMWDGTAEDYYRLYSTASKAIKTRFPKVMVGGPGAASAGGMKDGKWQVSPFIAGLLEHCRKESAPLDFYSWHIYSNDPAAVIAAARGVRQVLDERGFTKAESHLNEWNYLPDGDWKPMLSRNPRMLEKWVKDIGSARGAAFDAAVLLGLQDAPLDVGNFYTGDNGPWGLFTQFGVPRKSYHAFRAFKSLADHPHRVALEGAPGSAPGSPPAPGKLYAAAGLDADGRELVVMLSNYRSSESRFELVVDNLPWKTGGEWEVLVLDESRDLQSVRRERFEGGTVRVAQELPAPGVLLLHVRRSPASATQGAR